MEIAELPFDESFQAEVRSNVEITDPKIVELANKIDKYDKNKAEGMLYTYHRKLIEGEITTYTEQQVLQLAAVFLRVSNTLALQAGDLMKAWYKQNKSAAQNLTEVKSDTAEKASKTLK